MKSAKVIIIGAGPVGTFAAYCLAEYGIETLVLESESTCETDMRASTFHPSTLKYLDNLNLADELIEKGLKAPIFQYRIRSTDEVLEFNLQELDDVLDFPFRLQCEQYKFARMLAGKLDRHRHSSVLFNRKLINFSEGNNKVTLDVDHHGTSEQYQCDYLIGADGANSIVRRNLGIEFSGFTYEEKFFTLSTQKPLENYFSNLSYVNYVSDPEEWFVLLKAPSAWRILVPVPQTLDDKAIKSNDYVSDIFTRVLNSCDPIETIHRTIYRVHQRVVNKMRYGRIMLAGDSAHLNNPLGGFGMNGGLHDAWNLAEKLDGIINHKKDEDLLNLYDRQRRTVMNDFIQKQTIRNKKMIEETGDANYSSEWMRMRNLHENENERRDYMLRQSMTQSLINEAAIK
ncbi:MAG: FAD-dependent monooxygenase [Gammaproteobacteria bacterium]|nr:FAD-dependent monooxygenase [Gammaproteobacteria bacterium]MDA7596691.1 FAD-dependent monooxygenase [Gammaproteobacteria bacterium]|tara:strand:- start:1735 stop:2931 length:1197 start_codon:yes stop_codon:yes gene_type:complete